MNNNNFELTIAIKGLEVTSNGCTCEDIQFTSKGNFGNEYVAILGETLNHMLTKIPDASAAAPTPTITSTSTPVSTVTTSKSDDTFCEIQKSKAAPEKVERRLNIIAAYQCLEKTLVNAGWESDNYGNLKYKNKNEECEISLENKKIVCHFHTEKTHVNLYIREKHTNVLGIAPQFVEKWFKESTIPGIQNVWEIIKDFVSDKEED